MDAPDLAITHIERLVSSGMTVSAGMERLFTYCEERSPGGSWESARNLPFDADVSNLTTWLENVLSNEPPALEIEAYWFGLFNPVRYDLESCDLYLAGSDHFQPNSQSADWAVNPQYFPKGRYAESAVLHALHRISASADDDAGEFADYTLCLGFACLAVAAICTAVEPITILGSRASRAVVVGFDSGDFVVLGSVDQLGFHHLNQGRA
jgi:hypothetical protein